MIILNYKSNPWGIGSVGRAPALHAGCQEFESPILHFLKRAEKALFYWVSDFGKIEKMGFGGPKGDRKGTKNKKC